MNEPRRLVILMAPVVAGLVWACGPQRVRPPERPAQDLIVLLPDPDTGATGGAIVSNPAGQITLATARDSTRVVANQPPATVTIMSEAEVQHLFRDVLSALPPPPHHVTLYFRFESDELTDESRALVPKVLQTLKGRPVPEVVVVGHTDTTGTPASNFELGLKRANMVRALLIEAGLDASFVEVTSHGEAELLVPTADEVLEPRNRRVVITIR